MRMILLQSRLLLTVILLLLAQFACAAEVAEIYVIRHAERAEDGTSDPDISAEGRMRALAFAALLRDRPVTHVFSTDYKRTMNSARPTAEDHGLSIEQYDPRDLPGLAERLKTLQGTIMVMGHSNTTTRVVNLLTGSELADLEEHIYDRVYVVSLDSEGGASYQIQFTLPRTP